MKGYKPSPQCLTTPALITTLPYYTCLITHCLTTLPQHTALLHCLNTAFSHCSTTLSHHGALQHCITTLPYHTLSYHTVSPYSLKHTASPHYLTTLLYHTASLSLTSLHHNLSSFIVIACLLSISGLIWVGHCLVFCVISTLCLRIIGYFSPR